MRKNLLFIALIIILGCNRTIDQKTTQIVIEEKIQLPETAIPFMFQKKIFINVKFNDSINGSFIFDSGSDQLYLDSSFVANNNIHINTTKKKKIRGVGKNTPLVPVSDNAKMRIDTLSKTYNNVPIVDLRSMIGVDVDGIFGTDFFKEFVLRINFDSSYLQIIKPIDFTVPKGYDTLKLFLTENKTIIKCEAIVVDSITVEGWAILDLGSSYSLTFTSVISEEYDFNKIIKNKYSYTHKNTGYGGDSRSYFFRAKKLKIGRFTMHNPIMNYSTDKKGALSMWGVLGLLGTKVMKRFDLIFDFPNKKLYIKPNSLFDEHFFSNSTGFTGRMNKLDSVFIINNIFYNSPAKDAGLKIGDTITHINGLNISSYSRLEIKNLFKQTSVELKLTIKRNRNSIEINILPKELL